MAPLNSPDEPFVKDLHTGFACKNVQTFRRTKLWDRVFLKKSITLLKRNTVEKVMVSIANIDQ